MNGRTVEALREAGDRMVNRAARRLLDDDNLTGAQADLEWAEVSARLIAAHRRRSRPAWTLLILAACLLLVGVAWTVHRPHARVAAEVTTRKLEVTLTESHSANHPFVADRIYLDNLSTLEAPGLPSVRDVRPTDGEAMALDLGGSDINISRLALPSGATVSMAFRKTGIDLWVRGPPITVELFVRRARLNLDTGNRRIEAEIDLEVPETLTLKTVEVVADPVRLSLTGVRPFRLSGMVADSLSFADDLGTDGERTSGVTAGRVELPATGREAILRPGDGVLLGKIRQCRRLEIEPSEAAFTVRFEGPVADVRAGPWGYEAVLTPTWLEFLYHQKRLTLFWGAVAFLFGILWRIRSTVIGGNGG